MSFKPDSSEENSLEWALRQFWRISDADSLHTAGNSPTLPATGASWNAHGNTATGDATTPLEIDAGAFIIDTVVGDAPAGLNKAGTYFAWIPSKEALRIGSVGDNSWANPGQRSYVIGGPLSNASPSSFVVGGGSNALGNTGYIFGNGCTIDTATNSIIALGINIEAGAGGFTVAGVAVGVGIDIGDPVTFSGQPVACGVYLGSRATNAAIFGTGKGSTRKFVNSKSNSLMLGANIDSDAGDLATLTLFNKNCGIENHDPLSTLDIKGSVGFKYTNLDTDVVVDDGEYSITGDEYTFRIDMSALTSANDVFTINLPVLGPTTTDRRIYYFKACALTASPSGTARIEINPDGTDQIEDWDGLVNGGIGVPLGAGVALPIDVGDSITIIANNTDGVWWVI